MGAGVICVERAAGRSLPSIRPTDAICDDATHFAELANPSFAALPLRADHHP
jgi:hypothetical protein